ncbi:MAG: hypothetical protein ACPGU1_16020 [Myxococcota bacterium]
MLTAMWKRMCVVLLVVGALSASACDLILLVLTVSNDSPVDVCEVYVSSSASNSWGSNELSSGAVLSTGETFDILMVSGTYDLRFVDCMGTEGTVMGVELYDDTSVSYQY